jgi:hypothetical protein
LADAGIVRLNIGWLENPIEKLSQAEKPGRRRAGALPCGNGLRLGKRMKVILRNPDTDLYFLGPNMWTNDRSKALDFGHAERAVELARRADLQGLEMILSFSSISYDFRLPLAHITRFDADLLPGL